MTSSRYRDKKGTASARGAEPPDDRRPGTNAEPWLNLLAAIRQVVASGITDQEFDQAAIQKMQLALCGTRRAASAATEGSQAIVEPKKLKAVEDYFVASDQLLMNWRLELLEARELEDALSGAPGARDDFEKLCAAGCHRELLAIILSILREYPPIKAVWDDSIGSSDKTESIRRTLEAAATVLDALPFNGDEAKFAEVGTIAPPRLASELRLYARMLNAPTLVADEMGVRSLKKFMRLILASYVEKATGDKYHASIAAIIAAVCSQPNYTADAQKQFWYDNSRILESVSFVSQVADFLRDSSSRAT